MGAARLRANRLAGVVAVHGRHLDVHEHGMTGAGLDGRHGRRAVGGLGDRESRALQRATHQQARARVVVDDQDVDGFPRGELHQATFAEFSSASSSDRATVRCARSLVTEEARSLRSPPRAECSIWRAMAATLVAPRLALELLSVCAARATPSASLDFIALSMSARSCELSSRYRAIRRASSRSLPSGSSWRTASMAEWSSVTLLAAERETF